MRPTSRADSRTDRDPAERSEKSEADPVVDDGARRRLPALPLLRREVAPGDRVVADEVRAGLQKPATTSSGGKASSAGSWPMMRSSSSPRSTPMSRPLRGGPLVGM